MARGSNRRARSALATVVALIALALVAVGCGRGDDSGGGGGGGAPGVTDKSIKLGGSYPFSGPASAYGTIGRAAKAHFDWVNSKGGINGRKIEFTTLDDGYDPARAVSNARRLVTQEKVFALFNTLGTANNLAIWDYTNQQKVPQLYVATGGSDFGVDPKKHPYTIGWQPDYVSEAQAYAEFLKKEKPNAKVAMLYQNDSFGKDLTGGFEKAIEGSNIKVVARESYEVTDPSVAPQISKLAGSGADTFLDVTTPKPGAQAIAAVAKSGWRPLHILNNVAASKTLVLKPVGFKAAQGIVSTTYFKDPEDPQWADDPAMTEYKAQLKKFAPKLNPDEPFNVYGWAAASTMVKALEQAGPDLTRDKLMDAVRNMQAEIPLLLPGIQVKTGPDDGYPIQSNQIMRFQGENWKLEGQVINAAEK
jgi:branched-chain amino acid transport system substrate-binding protein